MREIKFRGWNGRSMEYGGFCIHAGGTVMNDTVLTDIQADSPVMQYTGLKDKNGVDIYEGDIVNKEYAYSVKEVGSIKFMDGGFMVYFEEEPEASFFIGGDNHRHEIIGNIYENPELLQDKTNEG